MMLDFDKTKVVPVAVLNSEQEAEEALFCLREGGLFAIEITYRTEYAGEAIRYATKNYPEIAVGAGTVINAEQCRDAIANGASFIVGPGFSAEVAMCCKDAKIPYIPGVVTPTEIMAALAFGITTLKFFPCSAFGGLDTVSALSGPFPSVRFMLTGGISGNNFTEYLAHPAVVAIGGSWMLKGTREQKIEKIKQIVEKTRK